MFRDELDISFFLPGTPEAMDAVHILREDLLANQHDESITDELDGLDTVIYLVDEKVVAVSAIRPDDLAGEYTLEYFAVTKNLQGRGIGRVAMGLLLEQVIENSYRDSVVLRGSALADVITFYTSMGALEDQDEGGFYFELGESTACGPNRSGYQSDENFDEFESELDFEEYTDDEDLFY